MKSYFVVSAPVRYLAYASVLAMALSMLLEPSDTPKGQKQPQTTEQFPQSYGNAADISMLFLKNASFTPNSSWKIRMDAPVSFLREMAESVAAFCFQDTVLEEFSEEPPLPHSTLTCGN